jgi:hypothetical protein
VHGIIRSYRDTLPDDRRRLLERFRYAHAARKVVGVGSVGTRAWIALMLGRDNDDPLFLQLTEAEASVLEPFLGRSQFANHGQRVVEGQRLMQSASDLMLGWVQIQRPDGPVRDFYVRQLWDAKRAVHTVVAFPTLRGRRLRRMGSISGSRSSRGAPPSMARDLLGTRGELGLGRDHAEGRPTPRTGRCG